MKRLVPIALSLVLVLAGVAAHTGCATAEDEGEMEMPFGGPEDVTFAKNLWQGMMGYESWKMSSDYYEGMSPHGAFLRMYYNVVNVEGAPYHVIVKDNFGGEGATLEKVAESSEDYLAAVTVMVQRHEGYDPENRNWYYVKYDADGAVSMNEESMALAGRVAKGMDSGCIACHAKAGGDDYIFTND
ncbi:MAG: hypothetical protein GF400_08590 [Candidatus Eisenbacteria bacterium]|nr:hypothetical protein [Candidatus Eisenbacteria bacterium]